MNIAFDVDGVVLKSIEVILDSINRSTGRNLSPDDLKSWDLEPLGLDTPTLWKAVEHMYAQPSIRPYEGAVRVLSRIASISSKPLLFITGRSDPATARRQLEALPWNPIIPDMVVTGGNRDKRVYLTESDVDFIVEDDTKHLVDYLDSGFGVGLMLQPWNRSAAIPVTRTFNGWNDVENWFFTISKGMTPSAVSRSA